MRPVSASRGATGMYLTIPISARVLRGLLYALLGAGVGFALLHLLIQSTAEALPWGPLRAVFDLDEELSVPTWFSSTQLFVIGAVLALASLTNQRRDVVPNWLLLAGAALFVLLSMDEGAMLHERLSGVARRQGLDVLLFGQGRGAWILPYAAFALIVLLITVRPLMRIAKTFPAPSRVAIAGVAMIGIGAAGMELISFYTVPEPVGMWYQLEVAVEEGLEMTGASLILYACMRLAGACAGVVPEPAAPPRSQHAGSPATQP